VVEAGLRGRGRLKEGEVPRVVVWAEDVGVEEGLILPEHDQVLVPIGTETRIEDLAQTTSNLSPSYHRCITGRCSKRWKIFYNPWLRALVRVSFLFWF
jgi:hypothetical protein